MLPFDYRQNQTFIDFPAVADDGQLERCKVRLSVIIGFGVEHVPVRVAGGTFSRWQSWGYLLTSRRRYRVSVRLVRAWQRNWRWELLTKTTLLGIRRGGIGTVHRAVDWEFKLQAPHRRGGAWPRCRRGSEPLLRGPLVTV